MDERQTQIREGAGLEESRLNVEFIDLLRKWSSPVLILAAVLTFGYWGWQKLQESRLNRLNSAFKELDAAGGGNDPSPDSLRAVAAEYGDVQAVGTIARLEAADVYLGAVRLGVKVGAQPEADENGQPTIKADDLLNDADRTQYLSSAEGLYKQVVADTQAKTGMNALHTLSGLYGLAAVSESRGDMDQAKAYYEQVVSAAQRVGLDAHATVAKARIANLDALKTTPKVYNTADLPKPPAPPAPPPAPADENAPAGDDGAPAPDAGNGAEGGDQPAAPNAPDAPAPDAGQGQDQKPDPDPRQDPTPDQPK